MTVRVGPAAGYQAERGWLTPAVTAASRSWPGQPPNDAHAGAGDGVSAAGRRRRAGLAACAREWLRGPAQLLLAASVMPSMSRLTPMPVIQTSLARARPGAHGCPPSWRGKADAPEGLGLCISWYVTSSRVGRQLVLVTAIGSAPNTWAYPMPLS